MISKQEHNYIIDTLIKRIDQLEKQLNESQEAADIITKANNNKAITIMGLEKELEAKDKIIEMFKNTKAKKQQHLDKLKKENKILKELVQEER